MTGTTKPTKPNFTQAMRLAVLEAIIRLNRLTALCEPRSVGRDLMTAEGILKIAEKAEQAEDPNAEKLINIARRLKKVLTGKATADATVKALNEIEKEIFPLQYGTAT